MVNDASIMTFRRGRVYPYNYVFLQESVSFPGDRTSMSSVEWWAEPTLPVPGMSGDSHAKDRPTSFATPRM